MKKITIHTLSLAAITAGLFLTPAVAQQGRPDPAQMVQMRVDRMNEELKLSKAQQKQITGFYMDAQTANQSVTGGMKTANDALVAAIKSNDAAAMSQAANTVGTLTAQITVNNAKAEAQVYAALTPDQQAKFTPRAAGGGYGGGYGGQNGGRRRGGNNQQ